MIYFKSTYDKSRISLIFDFVISIAVFDNDTKVLFSHINCDFRSLAFSLLDIVMFCNNQHRKLQRAKEKKILVISIRSRTLYRHSIH